MDHLAAYVALARWVSGRDVLVWGGADADGLAHLMRGGARRVRAVDLAPDAGGGASEARGVAHIDRDQARALPEGSLDLVVAIESYARLDPAGRHDLVEVASRVLAPTGQLAVWLPIESADRGLEDYWAMEDELHAAFDEVAVIAQIPWQGYSLAPVVEDDVVPRLRLGEDLLAEVPEASHYLALASQTPLSANMLADCLLVPLPSAKDGAEAPAERVAEMARHLAAAEEELLTLRERVDAEQAAAAELRAELVAEATRAEKARGRLEELEADLQRTREQLAAKDAHGSDLARREAESEIRRQALEEECGELRDRLRRHETDLAVLARSVEEKEQALERVTEALRSRGRDLEARGRALEEVQARLREAQGERDELQRQVDVAVAEREGARQLAQRAEAELSLAREKLAEHEHRLASRIEEASRARAEADVLKERLAAQEATLQQTRSQTEALNKTAAQSAEQGRVLTEVALDRDRLREELTRRSSEISTLEERLWAARDELQRAQLEVARLSVQLEAANERADRSHERAAAQSEELQRLSRELRAAELAKAAQEATLRAREEELQRLAREAEVLGGASEDVQILREQLRSTGQELAQASAALEQARAREATASERARAQSQRAEELQREVTRLSSQLDESRQDLVRLRGEADVARVSTQQLERTVSELQAEIEAQRGSLRDLAGERDELQQRLEESAFERSALQRQLAQARAEVEQLHNDRLATGDEAARLRKELDEASRRRSELAAALEGGADGLKAPVDPSWPADAQARVVALQGELAAQARELAAVRVSGEEDTAGDGRVRIAAAELTRLHRELDVRAQEQEQMLAQLDASEQKIWEMTDAADRNAARLAASLAQLEHTKEQLDEVQEELQVTRNLLAAAQARALEQERLLGSERAKLARAGLGPEGLPLAGTASGVDDVFRDLNPQVSEMVDLSALPEAGAPAAQVHDRTATGASASRPLGPGPAGPRIQVEALEDDDDDWPDAAGADGPASSPGGDGSEV